MRLSLGGKCRELVDYVLERSRIKMAKADRASVPSAFVRLAARLVGQIDPIRNRLPISETVAVPPGTAEQFFSDTLMHFCVCAEPDSFKEVKATLQGPGAYPP
ncbi:hypothetical protein MES5069_110096 [Mesorhizobium escarrei]|uniref:Uncharacterized protein n=1 Tax=Mesorhizobium escarrei TaxID=666018 RepID=A0ABM9DGH1_9HYPH|nr:hypothetical protein MES5069_110096 [Mesorhizobium escarrei]